MTANALDRLQVLGRIGSGRGRRMVVRAPRVVRVAP